MNDSSKAINMGSQGFSNFLSSSIKTNKMIKVVNEFRIAPNHFRDVVVTFINLEKKDGTYSGADEENNKITLCIHGFNRDDRFAPTEGKVKVEQLVCSYNRSLRLRGKTGSPEVIAQYVIDYIEKISTLPAKLPEQWK